MAEIHDILIRPLINEKATLLEADQNTYVFQVGLAANKHEIKDAIERFFGVKVEDVRTLVVRGKYRRYGQRIARRADWKKAYVRVAAGQQITFVEA